MQAALRLLRSRDRTEAEIQEALASKGFPTEQVEQVLKTLKMARYVDDARIAERAVELATREHKGAGRVESDLQSRGAAQEAIDLAISSATNKDELAELAFWKTRKPGDTPGRAAARLARRGFDEDTVRAVIERHFPEFD